MNSYDMAKIVLVKEAAKALYDVLIELGASRENSLALTNLEQSVLWAVKGITG